MKSGRAEKPEELSCLQQALHGSRHRFVLLQKTTPDPPGCSSRPRGWGQEPRCCWCCLLPALPTLGRSAAMPFAASVPSVTFGLSSSRSSPAGRHGAMCESILYVWFSTQPTHLLPHLNYVCQAVYLMLERSEPESLICWALDWAFAFARKDSAACLGQRQGGLTKG